MQELKTLLVEQMEDLLHAENQIVKALPKMSKAAHSASLREAFAAHLEETRGHIERLQQAFALLGAEPKAKTCKAMQGLIAEGEETIHEGKSKDKEDGVASDLALIVAAQKIEHYEISGYGSLRTLAEKIGQAKVARLLQETKAEEERADQLLTRVAQPLMQKAA